MKRILYIICLLFTFYPALQARPGSGGGGGGSGGGGGFHGGYYASYGHSKPMTPGEKRALLYIIIGVFTLVSGYAAYITYLYRNKGRINKEKMTRSHERDAIWDHDQIIASAEDTFMKLQAAWTLRDLRPVKQLLSSSFYRNNAYILDRYKARKIVNVVEDITIDKVSIIYFDDYLDDRRDSVAVLVEGRLKDYIIPETAPRVGRIESFKDALVFLRTGNNWVLDEIINNPDFYQVTKPKTFIET